MRPESRFTLFIFRNLHILAVACSILVFHFYRNLFTSYGLFRDELYYIACSDHLAFGYVDHPPFSPFLLWISRHLFGDSLFAIRLVPSFAHAGTVFLAGVLARQFGGNRFAQIFAALLAALAPGIIGVNGIFSMNSIEIVLWTALFSAFLQLQETQRPHWWLVIGVLIGIGMMNKISMGWIAVGFAVGLIATPQRVWLNTRWPWIAAAISLVLFLPYVLWNIQHDYAHLEFARNAARYKYASQNNFTFLTGLIDRFNPLALPVWTAGFIMLLFSSKSEFRVIGISITTVLAILLINVNSKSEYFNPAVIVLFAAGAVLAERWCSKRFRWLGYFYCFVIVVLGIIITPIAVDLLPPERLVSYMQTLGVSERNAEGKEMGKLPQHFADRFGWGQLTDHVAEVYTSLNMNEQKLTAIYVRNYGEAAAIDYYGRRHGLPKAFCGHNSYWYWGSERLNDSVEVLIAVGGSVEDYSDTFSEIVRANVHSAEFVMPYENNLPIYLCRYPRLRIREVWHTTKHFD